MNRVTIIIRTRISHVFKKLDPPITVSFIKWTTTLLSFGWKLISHTYSSLKLLGVTIDSDLNFSQHVSVVCKKESQKIGVINRLKNLIPTHAKLQLYKAAILPNMTYCQTVWHFCYASNKRKLERLQERGLRAVYCDKAISYENLLKRAKLPTLYNRRLQDIAILMYKVKHKFCPEYVLELFDSQGKGYNLRNADFSIPRVNTVTYGKHSLKYFGPYLWIRLDKKIKSLTSLESFKGNIRKVDLTALVESDCAADCALCT